MTDCWYLVHTKSGRELLADENLRRQGYQTYLPLERRTIRHARRTLEGVRAYFPGYLFVALDLTCRVWSPINSTFGVLRLVGGPEGPSRAPAGLVEGLRAASNSRGVLNLATDWAPGAKIQVISGPFANQLGVVEGMCGADRVRILFSIMNSEVRVLTPADTLRLAG